MIAAAAGLVIFAAMIAEAAVSSRNETRLRALGAVEPRDDVIGVMTLVYPASFLVMLAEGWWRGAGPDGILATGAAVFALAKALKYWAILTLGPRWTFRVLVPPGAVSTRGGPYRWLTHPNYVGVIGELLGVAIGMRALVGGPVVVAGFGVILLRRIRVEERALAGR
jgi:methyltransferase